MNKKNIFINTLFQFVGRSISATLAFFTSLLLARFLGGAYFGEYIKIVGFVTLFYPLVDFGLNTIYLRDFKEKIISTFSSFLYLRIGISALLVLLASLVMTTLSYISSGFTSLTVEGVVLTSIMLVGYGVCLTCTAIFQHRGRYDVAATAVGAGSLINLLLLAWFVQTPFFASPRGVFLSLIALILGMGVSVIWSVVSIKWLGQSFSVVFLKTTMFSLFKKSVPLGLTLIFNIVYFKIDLLILSAYKPNLEVGAYGLAYKFFEFALVLPTFLMNGVYPSLLLISVGSKLFWPKMRQLFITLFILSVVVGSVYWFGAPYLIFIKEDFARSVILLRILTLSLPLFFLTSPLMFVYVLLKKERLLVVVYAISIIVNLVGNFWFIPAYGAVAAAINTGITEIVVLVLGLIFLRLKNAHT